MNSKQRAYLRKLAQKTEPVFQIGKGGINENMIKMIDEALEARELIKITMLNNSPDELDEAANQIADQTNGQLVQIIGHKITLYRKSIKKNIIVLP